MARGHKDNSKMIEGKRQAKLARVDQVFEKAVDALDKVVDEIRRQMAEATVSGKLDWEKLTFRMSDFVAVSRAAGEAHRCAAQVDETRAKILKQERDDELSALTDEDLSRLLAVVARKGEFRDPTPLRQKALVRIAENVKASGSEGGN